MPVFKLQKISISSSQSSNKQLMNNSTKDDKFLKDFLFIGKFIILFFLGVGLIVLLAYLSGQWLPNYDLQVIELGACQNSTDFSPQAVLPVSAEQIYLCGRTTGTTFLNVVIYVFKDDSVIYQVSTKLEAGSFFIRFPKPEPIDSYLPGQYRVEVRPGRSIIAQAKFEIVAQ